MPKDLVISKAALRALEKKMTRTSSLVSFLQSLQNDAHCRRLLSLLKIVLEKPPKKLLFHGSNKPQAMLRPSADHVYATDDPNYAIFLATLDLRNGRAAVTATSKNTKLSVDLDFVNGASKLKAGYIHILPATGFKKAGNREYVSDQPVKPLCIIPVEPADLTVPIYVTTE